MGKILAQKGRETGKAQDIMLLSWLEKKKKLYSRCLMVGLIGKEEKVISILEFFCLLLATFHISDQNTPYF